MSLKEFKAAPPISRRVFVKSALASSVLYGLGCGSSSSAAVGSGPFDTAIVGAGMAGLTAANTLVAAGKRVIVLEARPRVGGRAFTDNTFVLPADLGAQWFHQGLVNPLIALANSRGVRTISDMYPRELYQGSTPVVATDPDHIPGVAQYLAMETAAEEAGQEIAQGTENDASMAAIMTAAGLAGEPWYNFGSNFIASDRGVLMTQLSTLDYFDFSDLTVFPVGTGSREEYLVPSGMGNFVAGFSYDIPIRLGTPVTAIDYSSKAVRVVTHKGDVTAKTAIVTAPLAVLSAGTLKFKPSLPPAYLSALEDFTAGVLDKVWLQYSAPVFGDVGVNTFISQLVDQVGGGIVVANLYGQNAALVLILAPTAGELESQGTSALINYAISAVNLAFPDATANLVVQPARVNPWGTDPWSMGSWAFALPGGVPGRASLAAPIDKRVFLAGDGLSLNSPSSLLGAYQSAQVAAQLVLLTLANPDRELGPDDVIAAYRRLGIRPSLRPAATP